MSPGPRVVVVAGEASGDAHAAKVVEALRACDGCVLVLPSGRSAHLEAGWAAGAGKRVVVYVPEPAPGE